ncbi:MAG TPA: response regulator [Bryobacteraceae bacterium]|jgi:CheY-like chemotaxis protein|nr:response regulator [Bryobacteraceae bacterium]
MDTASSPCQIVLAEDNPADVGLVRLALRDHGVHCELRVIPDGEAAVTFINGLDLDGKIPCPDLLLLDMHLPKRDGNEILRHLRASERCAQTPVVVLTSSEAASDRHNAEKNAAIHYFRKSASLDEFLLLGKIVKEVLSRAPSC